MKTTGIESASKQGAKVTHQTIMASTKPLKCFNPHYSRFRALVQLAQIEAGFMDRGKADSIEVFMYETGEWAHLTVVSAEGEEFGIEEYTGVIDFRGRTNRQTIDEIRGLIRLSKGESEHRYREMIRSATYKAITICPEQAGSIAAWASLF